MADVRSRRLWGPTLTTATTSQLLYTVPAGRTARLSLVSATTTVAAAVPVTLKINGITPADAFLKGSIPAGLSLEWPYQIVLNPGDLLYATAGATGGFYITGFGSLLLGAPA